MKYKLQWKEAVTLAKQGNINGFEEVYILTYKNVCRKIFSIIKDDLEVWNLLFDVYLEVHQRITEMPDGIKGKDWVISIAERRTFKFRKEQPEKKIEEKKKLIISEEKAATVLLKIEEELGLLKEIEKESNKAMTIIKVLVTVVLVFICTTSMVKVYYMMKTEQKVSNSSLIVKINSTEPKQVELPPVKNTNVNHIEPTVEKVEYQPGWLISEDGLIYYIGADLKKMLGHYDVDNFEFYFNESGELINFKNKEKDYSNVQDTIQHMNGWIFYLSREAGLDYYDLYRVLEEDISGDWKEYILEDINDYYILENSILYMKDNQLNIMTGIMEKEFVRQDQELHLLKEEDGFYIANEMNQIIFNNLKDSHMQIEDRIYRIKEGRIKYVKQNILPVKGVTYYINPEDSKLYWKNTKGESGRFVGEGLSIDSFCIVDSWVYYSVCTVVEQDRRYSQIRRIKTDGTVREDVTSEFQGNMTNMYYYQDIGQIYAEYLPEKSQYGKVAEISLNGTISVIVDEQERSGETTTGEDMLELIMVKNDHIYCYWHNCNWKGKNGVQILWTKPIILSEKNKVLLVQ